MRFVFLILLAAWAADSAAVEVKDLYVSEVIVASQKPEERNGAIRSALLDVLIKVTGRRDILAEPLTKGILKNAPRYVRQFSYVEEAAEEGELLRKLRVKFDAFALNEALKGVGVVAWSKDRPSILAWLAFKNGTKRFLLEPESYPELTATFQELAEKRGLPVLLPLMDLVDQRALSFADIWGNFEERISQASSRYGAETILSGRLLKKSPSRWVVDWTFYQQGHVDQWRNEARSAAVALSMGIDATFDLLAERYVINAEVKGVEEHRVQIKGIIELADIIWLEHQVKALSIVKAFEWHELNGGHTSLLLTVKGDKASLRQSLESIDRLFSVETEEGVEGELNYQLQP